MFETLESRRMMSVSTTTTQDPIVITTPTISANESQLFSFLHAAYNNVSKSIADAAQSVASKS